MTRLRAAVLAAMSAALGGVAVGGLRLMDSRSSYIGFLGAATVLGVALVVDALRPRARPADADIAQLRARVEVLDARLDQLEARIIGLAARPSSSGSAGRSGSYPAL